MAIRYMGVLALAGAFAGCAVDAVDGVDGADDATQEAQPEAAAPATSESVSAVNVDGCKINFPWDQLLDYKWYTTAISSDAVDLGLGVGPLYNAYSYDYGGQCDRTFVTDITSRPQGNTKIKWRAALGALDDTRMTPDRCGQIKLELVIYATKFHKDPNQWTIVYNRILSSTYVDGRCTLAGVNGGFDYKDEMQFLGAKPGHLRFALTGFEFDNLRRSCLVVDTDDQGDNLDQCPVLVY